jgi:two-component system phosphate regulon response regulator OmpR
MIHESRAGRGRILVVDDDLDIRTILDDFLTSQGFIVRTASDGRTALALFSAEPFDALLVDLQMPDMTGLEVAVAIREKNTQIPLALVTGSSHVLTREELERIGIDHLFAKPFDLHDIGSWLASISL